MVFSFNANIYFEQANALFHNPPILSFFLMSASLSLVTLSLWNMVSMSRSRRVSRKTVFVSLGFDLNEIRFLFRDLQCFMQP